MSVRERLFQLEVLDFRHRGNEFYSYKDDVVSDGKGGKIKLVDTLPIAPTRTLLKRAKSEKIAKRWGARFGSVISCCKVDVAPYYKNIEYLNIREKPISVNMEQDFVINKELEVMRVNRDEKHYNIEVEK